DVAKDQDLGWNDVFVAGRLIVSLIIGFLAGVIAAISLGVENIATAFAPDMLTKLAAAGYIGTDAIEAFTAGLAGATDNTSSRNPQKWGYAMPPDGLGWGRGLMQVDYAESDFGKTGPWMDPTANILFGSNDLATK